MDRYGPQIRKGIREGLKPLTERTGDGYKVRSPFLLNLNSSSNFVSSSLYYLAVSQRFFSKKFDKMERT